MTEPDKRGKHSGDKEIEELLNIRFEQMNDLEFLDDGHTPRDGTGPDTLPKGKSGLETLKKSTRLDSLDKHIESQKPGELDRDPLKNKINQIGFNERTEEYLNETAGGYSGAIKTVENLYRNLAARHRIHNQKIQDIVSRFMRVLFKDQSLLINFAAQDARPEDYLFQHAVNTSIMAVNIATAVGYTQKYVLDAGVAGLLADIGMMWIPEHIRKKKDRLNSDEYYEIQKHPILSTAILEYVEQIPEEVVVAAYQHHERLTGAGYPKNRSGRLIHDYSSIVAIADVYVALASNRAYRPGMHASKAILQTFKMGKIGLLDMNILQSILSTISLFPVGCLVVLSNYCVARVVRANKEVIDKPVVSVIADERGRPILRRSMTQIDLMKSKDIRILKPLDSDKIQLKLSCTAGF